MKANLPLFAGLVLIFSVQARASLITNGDFSADNPLASDFVYPATPMGWIDGGLDTGNSFVGQDVLELFDGLAGPWQHPLGGQGNTSVDINDRILQQSVTGLTSGLQYKLDFLLYNLRFDTTTVTTVGTAEILNSASSVFASYTTPSLTNQNMDFGSIVFTAPIDGEVTVQFRTVSSTEFNQGIQVDDVSLNAVTSTPEPTSMALLGLASLGGIGLRWRQRRKAQAAA
jgi:hypothetical protein